jgi:hypothetical protein
VYWGTLRSLQTANKELMERADRYPNPRGASITRRLFVAAVLKDGEVSLIDVLSTRAFIGCTFEREVQDDTTATT